MISKLMKSGTFSLYKSLLIGTFYGAFIQYMLVYVVSHIQRIGCRPPVLSTCPLHTNSVWEREANIYWSMVTCQGSTRSELP